MLRQCVGYHVCNGVLVPGGRFPPRVLRRGQGQHKPCRSGHGGQGLHGPLQPCVQDKDGATKCPTSFPAPCALASAFNDTLYHYIGAADGLEARAINNLRNHQTQNVYGDGIDYWSPTVNMQRDPRWGRNQEVVSARLCRKLWHPLLR